MTTHPSIPAQRIPQEGPQESLVGYSPRGHKEWDMTEQLTHNTNEFLYFVFL